MMDPWCQNCLEAPATRRIEGYEVCEECEVQACLPPYLRGR